MRSLSQRLLSRTAATVDRAVIAAMQLRSRGQRARTAAMSHDQRIATLASIRDTYGDPELVSRPEAFFAPPPRVDPREHAVRRHPWGAECIELSWPSAVEPFSPRVRDAYLAHVANRTAWARLYTGGGPRPAAIVVHGYMAGQWSVEERAWPIRWLNQRGLDVAVAVLPFHGVRARAEGGSPPFPGPDPRFTVEGFRQAVGDLRVLIAFLKRRGATAVGLMGMSLGGYTTALMATLEDELAFVAPLIPLASLADVARDQGDLGAGPRASLQHAALAEATHVVSPFARPSRVDPRRALVVGAVADQVTPIVHAERVAAHLGAPLLRVNGGHLLQIWRREAFRGVRDLLCENGVL